VDVTVAVYIFFAALLIVPALLCIPFGRTSRSLLDRLRPTTPAMRWRD
jgi:hypothetical protein